MSGTTNIPVVGVIFRKDDKVLVVRRANTGYMDGHYDVPGGHVEDRESFSQAACREALEEVGIKLKPEQLTFKVVMHELHRKDVRVGFAFEVTDWEGEPYNAEPEKHDEIAWLDTDNLPENIKPSMIATLECIKKGEAYGEFGWDTPIL